jgi:ATP-dependent Clp protease protease subunit
MTNDINAPSIDGVDLKLRRVQLIGEVDEAMFAKVDSALAHFEKTKNKKVTFVINSFGGSVFDAHAIVGRMRSTTCKIQTEGYGAIMSAATAILAAGSTRLMSTNAIFMHHEGSYFLRGRHSEMRHEIFQRDKEETLWANLMAELTNQTADYWLQTARSGKDLYLTANECLAFGIVDKII